MNYKEKYEQAKDGFQYEDMCQAKNDQLTWVKAFIDSLPEEHASEDLEEEIDRFEDWLNNFNQSDYPTSYTVRDIARHFAEWQRKKDQETIELAEEHAMLDGMEKMREEMMKDAVDGIVGGHTENPAWIDLSIENKPNVNVGDKVKLIIIKEDN